MELGNDQMDIVLHADLAAAHWAAHPTAERPTNPFSLVEQPEHYALWKDSFERSLLLHSADTPRAPM